MAIFSAIAGAIAGALFTTAAAITLATQVIAAGLALGTSLLVSYLNRPKKRAYAAVQGQIQYGADTPAGTVFGTAKVKGQRVYYAKWGGGNKYNAEVFALANGWCDGLEPEIWFYGEKHTLVVRPIIGGEAAHYGVDGFGNLISIRFYDGRPGQVADAKLVSDTAALGIVWKSTSVGAGICYVVVERQWDASKFEKGRPEFDFILRGLRLYDPRKDSTYPGGSGDHRLADPSTWEHSFNPAIQRLNYRLGVLGRVSGRALIGMGKPLHSMDVASHIAAANVCDTLRKGKPTYICSLFVQADDDHTEMLREFEDTMAGYAMNRGGLSGVIAGAPQIPVYALGPNDIRVDEAQNVSHRKSSFDTYNIMSGQFLSKESGWKPESLTTVTVNADVSADGRKRQTGHDFLQVTDPDIAQYLLNIRYRQNRYGGAAEIPVSRRAGLAINVGDWITFAGKAWLVNGRKFDRLLKFRLSLAETSADIYDDEDILPGPVVVPPPIVVNPSLLSSVTGFLMSAGMLDSPEGVELPSLVFTWDPPDDPTTTAVRIEYFAGTDPTGKTIFQAVSAEPEIGHLVVTENVLPGTIYSARATISTVPDRLKTWTSWIAAAPTGNMALPWITLAQDVRETFQQVRAQQVELRNRMEVIAAGAADVAGTSSDLHTVARRFRGGTAVALREMSASVTEVDGKLTAQAAILDAVQAIIGDIDAGVLWRMTAEAGEGDVVARVVLQVRASIGDVWVTAGTIWEAGFEGGDPEKPFSRTVFQTGDTVWMTPTGELIGLFSEDGLTIDLARLKDINTGQLAFGSVTNLDSHLAEDDIVLGFAIWFKGNVPNYGNVWAGRFWWPSNLGTGKYVMPPEPSLIRSPSMGPSDYFGGAGAGALLEWANQPTYDHLDWPRLVNDNTLTAGPWITLRESTVFVPPETGDTIVDVVGRTQAIVNTGHAQLTGISMDVRIIRDEEVLVQSTGIVGGTLPAGDTYPFAEFMFDPVPPGTYVYRLQARAWGANMALNYSPNQDPSGQMTIIARNSQLFTRHFKR